MSWERYITEKRLQSCTAEELARLEKLEAERVSTLRKAKACRAMAELVSGTFAGWRLSYNEPGYGTQWQRDVSDGLWSVEVYFNSRLSAHRLIAPEASAEEALAQIAGAFLAAVRIRREAERRA